MTKAKKRRAPRNAEDFQRHKERPTAERMLRGKWRMAETIDAGVRVAIDDAAHPLDALRHERLISQDQYNAGTDFEALYRSQLEIPQGRDSCTIWEPKGYASDDGPVQERARYKAAVRSIGMIHEQTLLTVCVHQYAPKGTRGLGELREALNAALHFFQPGGKKRLHPF